MDIVVGSHPHVIQPCELYLGKHIFYSLGNFYFGSRRETFPLGLSDYSCGFELRAGDGFSDPTSRTVTFRYDRDKDCTELIDSSDEWVSSIVDFKIPGNVHQYNEIYRKYRYGFKPSLLAGQTNKNNLKMKLFRISNDLKRVFIGSIVKIIR